MATYIDKDVTIPVIVRDIEEYFNEECGWGFWSDPDINITIADPTDFTDPNISMRERFRDRKVALRQFIQLLWHCNQDPAYTANNDNGLADKFRIHKHLYDYVGQHLIDTGTLATDKLPTLKSSLPDINTWRKTTNIRISYLAEFCGIFASFYLTKKLAQLSGGFLRTGEFANKSHEEDNINYFGTFWRTISYQTGLGRDDSTKSNLFYREDSELTKVFFDGVMANDAVTNASNLDYRFYIHPIYIALKSILVNSGIKEPNQTSNDRYYFTKLVNPNIAIYWGTVNSGDTMYGRYLATISDLNLFTGVVPSGDERLYISEIFKKITTVRGAYLNHELNCLLNSIAYEYQLDLEGNIDTDSLGNPTKKKISIISDFIGVGEGSTTDGLFGISNAGAFTFSYNFLSINGPNTPINDTKNPPIDGGFLSYKNSKQSIFIDNDTTVHFAAMGQDMGDTVDKEHDGNSIVVVKSPSIPVTGEIRFVTLRENSTPKLKNSAGMEISSAVINVNDGSSTTKMKQTLYVKEITGSDGTSDKIYEIRYSETEVSSGIVTKDRLVATYNETHGELRFSGTPTTCDISFLSTANSTSTLVGYSDKYDYYNIWETYAKQLDTPQKRQDPALSVSVDEMNLFICISNDIFRRGKRIKEIHLHDWYPDDKFELTQTDIDENLLATQDDVDFLCNGIDMLMGVDGTEATLEVKMDGHFIGRIVKSNVERNGEVYIKKSPPEKDKNYVVFDPTYDFESFPATPYEDATTPDGSESLYDYLRYSRAYIELERNEGKRKITIHCSSYVSPLRSRLDNKLTSDYRGAIPLAPLNAYTLPLATYELYNLPENTGSGSFRSYNLPLAVLRSWGFFEAIAYRFKDLSSTDPTVMGKLQGITTNAKSKDLGQSERNFGSSISIEIPYSDYQSFKWYSDATDFNSFRHDAI